MNIDPQGTIEEFKFPLSYLKKSQAPPLCSNMEVQPLPRVNLKGEEAHFQMSDFDLG